MHKRLKIISILIVIIALLILIAQSTNIYNTVLKKFYPMKYEEYVKKYSNEYNVDELLIYSIIKTESNFNEKVISSSGAKGLMQLMNSTAEELAKKVNQPLETKDSLLDPENNIKLGTKYYSDLSKTYDGNMLLALCAYNAGIGNVNEWIKDGTIKQDGSNIENIPFKETNMYIRKILNNYKMYKKLYQS